MAKAEIKNRIRRLRFEHGEMTQQELANRAGCTRQTIVLLEQGRYVPSLALAFRIARTFGATVEQVFEWDETSPSDEIDEILAGERHSPDGADAQPGSGAGSAVVLCGCRAGVGRGDNRPGHRGGSR